jgi:enamine deaminase RidA (YjgF/YER057c/UK114 family)
MAKKAKAATRRGPGGAIFYGDPLPFPISRAVRAGDFVITSGFGDRVPRLEEQVYDARGFPLEGGAHRASTTFADEVHATIRSVEAALALAGCALADVIDAQVWLKDPRDFAEMNAIYAGYFGGTRPIRTVFQNAFMMDFRVEMKVVAYKPVD